MRGWLVVVLMLAVLWTTIYSGFASLGDVVGNLLVGTVIGVLAVYPIRRIYTGRVPIPRLLRSVPPFLAYLAVFSWDVIVANVDVAQRILLPWAPIEPRVVVVPLEVESEYGVTTIANSITLTPGTLTMDYDDERHALIVHSMAGEDIVEPIRRWEALAIRIFDGGDGE